MELTKQKIIQNIDDVERDRQAICNTIKNGKSTKFDDLKLKRLNALQREYWALMNIVVKEETSDK